MPSSPTQDVNSVAFVSLGCPKNLVDSEKMLGLLAQDGLRPVAIGSQSDLEHADSETGTPAPPSTDFAGADAVVVNTCGFLEASKEESLAVIRDAVEQKNAGAVKRVVVAGCLVQRHRAMIMDWVPGIDAMIGVFDRDNIVRAVRGTEHQRDAPGAGTDPAYWVAANALSAARQRGMDVVGVTVNGRDAKGIGYYEDDRARLRLTPRHYAYLRVSEGCNQNCAFCTIPSIRGKMRSKPLERIRDEALELIADGAFELNLIGQDTTSFGDDIGIGFDEASAGGGLVTLLRTINDAVEQAGSSGWVRLMYAYPTSFHDAMIDAIAELPRIVKYIDIPLQHASDAMLTAMRRNVGAAQQAALIHRLRERCPGIAIRTTFITGFPGETEADHEALLAFIDEVGFEAVGVFGYSPEPGTPAGTMDSDPALHVDAQTKARRKHEILSLQQRLAFEQAEYVASAFDPSAPDTSGHRFDVLIDAPEGRAPDGSQRWRGRAYFQAPEIDSVTFVDSASARHPGELVRCTIVASDGYDLVARPVDELETRVGLPVLGS